MVVGAAAAGTCAGTGTCAGPGAGWRTGFGAAAREPAAASPWSLRLGAGTGTGFCGSCLFSAPGTVSDGAAPILPAGWPGDGPAFGPMPGTAVPLGALTTDGDAVVGDGVAVPATGTGAGTIAGRVGDRSTSMSRSSTNRGGSPIRGGTRRTSAIPACRAITSSGSAGPSGKQRPRRRTERAQSTPAPRPSGPSSATVAAASTQPYTARPTW